MNRTRRSSNVQLAKAKSQPFGSHFATRLSGTNNKLVCALSCDSGGGDDIENHGTVLPEIIITPGQQ